MNQRLIIDVSCGCADKAPISNLVAAQDTTLIACTHAPRDFKARIVRIRNLAARSLHSMRREPLRHYLTYAPEAAQDVRELIREEHACSFFCISMCKEVALGVHVPISASENARAAANGTTALVGPIICPGSELAGSPYDVIPDRPRCTP